MTHGRDTYINGEPVVTLERPVMAGADGMAFTRARVVPGRGMMLLQLSAHHPKHGHVDVLDSPPFDQARATLDAEDGEFPGNASFSMGGAILLPFANRVRGEPSPDARRIRTRIGDHPVSLPANWGGKREGAARYAMHGLILATPVSRVLRRTTDADDTVSAVLEAGDFGCGWPSSTRVTFEETLRSDAFTLRVVATNVGGEPTPIGIGWHPYFAIPSGRREQARLYLPAHRRVVADNYDEVLPTGVLATVAGTSYDYSSPGGTPLDRRYLDDCFVDLDKTPDGHAVAEVIDPAASYDLRIVSTSPHVRAMQVYAPLDRSCVAVEPQFNVADPFGSVWPRGTNTGMVNLGPGESVEYVVRLELFIPRDGEGTPNGVEDNTTARDRS